MSGKRVLIVDDDEDIVEYICTLLEDHGYEVRGAKASDAALSALEEFAADVVIIDVMMPGRSGLDLLVHLRKDQRWQQVPVLVLTGNDQVLEDGGRSYLSAHEGIRGADGVLGKPLDPSALFGALDSIAAAG